MSNSTTDANKNLFSDCIKVLNEQKSGVHQNHCMVFGSRKKEHEKKFKNLKLINSGLIIHGYPFAYMKDNEEDQYYVVVFNLNFFGVEFDVNVIQVENEFLSSFFLFLGLQKLIKFNEDALNDFYDNRLFEDNGDTFNYYSVHGMQIRQHKYEEIEHFFQEFIVFKVPKDSALFNESDSTNALIYLQTIQKKLITLPYDDNTINKFLGFSLNSQNNIPFMFILDALIAIRWKYAFKDLYRCIENQYGVSKVQNLLDKIGSTYNPVDARRHLEDILSWRPNELTSLEEICKKFKNNNGISSLASIFECVNEDIDKQAECVAKKIYKIRNSFVHFRDALSQDGVSYDDQQWNIIIYNMLILIENLYASSPSQ